MLKIAGTTLAGLACAARLSRLGHEVAVLSSDPALPAPEPTPVIGLPATWKDLFKKSGAHLQTELNRAGLEWAEAPPTRHFLTDGSILDLPTERGAQFQAIGARLGEAHAIAWRDLLDELDGVWRAFRRHALEGSEPVDDAARRALWLDRPLERVAGRLGDPLADLVLDLADDPSSPGLLALPLIVERSFGRWQLVDGSGTPQPATRLVDLLLGRLAERGVSLSSELQGPFDIDCRPALPARPGLPLSSTEFVEGAFDGAGVLEVRDHNQAAAHTSWQRPTPEGTRVLTLDRSTLTIAPGHPPQPRTAEEWISRTPIVGADGALRASADSPAGDEPWGELASAALAVYELHERLTGQDCRPTNVAFTLPRLPRG